MHLWMVKKQSQRKYEMELEKARKEIHRNYLADTRRSCIASKKGRHLNHICLNYKARLSKCKHLQFFPSWRWHLIELHSSLMCLVPWQKAGKKLMANFLGRMRYFPEEICWLKKNSVGDFCTLYFHRDMHESSRKIMKNYL